MLLLVLDRIDEPTLDWFHGQRRALAAAGVVEPTPRTHADSRAFLEEQPGAVGRVEGEGELVPILYRWLGPQSEEIERFLIDLGVIRAVGFRPR